MTAKVTYLPGVVGATTPAGGADGVDLSRLVADRASNRAGIDRASNRAGIDRASNRAGIDHVEVDDDIDDLGGDPPMTEGERAAHLENIVVRALARKSLSEWEVTRLLAANGVDESEFEIFLDRYRENRYVDDYDLAETLVESLHRRKGLGRSQLKYELATRHIQPEIISAALESLDDDDELQRAIELAEKRAPSLARLDAETAERRLTSFLMRKGYPSGVIRTAVTTALTPQPRGVRFR
ncbi:regulatory protein RecX [Subtercola sp. YIM 133946]|uniref:regulatory protein RecX n=1 Tax=Subtercola sp. YIM 133946 TaxID=3118909 RepID=UPI002F95F22A